MTSAREAIRSGGTADVPCDGCTACCTSSQFVHIGPDETDTLAHIPPELVFPAPRLPSGHVVLGYDEEGRCPMLSESGCSIYEHRPRACRTYDCRVFPAADVVPEDRQEAVAARARRWRFDYPADEDRQRHHAVRRAASFLAAHPDALPEGMSAANSTQLAALAVVVHEVFLPPPGSSAPPPEPDPATVLAAARRIGRGGGRDAP